MVLIERVRLKNWKNYRDADVALSQRTFVVGPNGSGKSNLLDALRFVRDLAVDAGGLQSAVSRKRRGFRLLRTLFHHGPRSQIELELDVRIDQARWTYFLGLEKEPGKKDDRAIVLEERVILDGTPLLNRSTAKERLEERLQTHLEQSARNAAFEPLVHALRSIRYAHLVPQLLRTTKLHGDLDLEDFGSRFLERVALTPQRTRKARLARINRALKSVLPFFRDLALNHDALGQPHLELRLRHWRTDDAWQNEESLSDGTLRLIGLLWEIADEGGPLLLEEPELSLHSKAVRLLPELVATVAGERQVILTTHAFTMFDRRGVDPSEIVLVKPGHGRRAEASVIESGSHTPEILQAVEYEVELGRQLEQLTASDGIDSLVSGR